MSEPRPIILAIDDVPANLLTLGAALADEFDVQTATSGAMGLELALAAPPDLILLDVMMPGMDGYETCRRIKNAPTLRHIPVIFISALNEVDAESSGLALGAVDYITKPVNVDIARQRIRNLMEREALRKQSELAASVFTYAREGIMITDAHTRIIDVNETFTRITGYTRDEALGQTPRLLSSGRHDNEFYQAIWASLSQSGHWCGEIWNRRKDGEVYAELLTISTVPTASGGIRHYVGLFFDITQSKNREQRLDHMAHYDPLTELPNRLLLSDRLHQSMAQAQRRKQLLTIVYIDLDGFKVVNDQHGHDIGDMLLITLASRMKSVMREADTLARLGGDEFVALLVDMESSEHCLPLLTRLLEAASSPVHLADLTLSVSASLGVTHYPQAENVEEDILLHQADQAMYQAKQAGKNRYQLFAAGQ